MKLTASIEFSHLEDAFGLVSKLDFIIICKIIIMERNQCGEADCEGIWPNKSQFNAERVKQAVTTG